MEKQPLSIAPHPQFLELLFAHKGRVFSVFRDVLGIHEIDHIAITHLNRNNELLTLSSTPAMEFNLFTSSLWRFDNTYHPLWFNACSQSSWQSLYQPSRYDELYYLKQIKHHYPIGCSMAARIENKLFIFSLASKKSCGHTQEIFSAQYQDFYKIGQYCTNMLHALLTDEELPPSHPHTSTQVEHET